MVMDVAKRTEEAMSFIAKKNDVFCYAWRDAQAGQLRFSIKKLQILKTHSGQKWFTRIILFA